MVSSTWCGRHLVWLPAMHGRKSLKASKDLIGDWVDKKCGNYNIKTNKCGGSST